VMLDRLFHPANSGRVALPVQDALPAK
jgi:hypothetical protein